MTVFFDSEAEGFKFGAKGSGAGGGGGVGVGGGVAVFDSKHRLFTEFYNEIAFGFMTWSKNGTLLRLSSSSGSAYYFSIALVKAKCVTYILNSRPPHL